MCAESASDQPAAQPAAASTPPPSPLLDLASATLSCLVSVDGQPLPAQFQLLSVAIEHTLGGASALRVFFSGEVVLPSLGAQVEVRAGYVDAAQLNAGNVIFSGEVTAHEFAVGAAVPATTGFAGRGSPSDAVPPPEPVLTLTCGEDINAAKLANTSAQAETTTGEISFCGSARVRPGDRVVLAGMPAAFCGVVPVRGVKHTIAEGLWMTTIECGAAANAVGMSDAHGNSIQLDAQGITLRSAGAVKVDGLTVNLAAQTDLVARGNASAELSGGAETVVRGAMVRIN